MPDNVQLFPGVYRADLDEATPVERVLKSAADDGLLDIAIVGRQVDGTITLYSSHPNIDAVIGLLVRGTHKLAVAQQIADPEDGDD